MPTRSGILLRADANPRMGTGHVMRGLALAQTLQEVGCEVTLATAELPPFLADRWQAANMKVCFVEESPGSLHDVQQVIRLSRELPCSWVVIDGYHFGFEYQRLLRDSGCRVLFIDDYGHAGQYCADLVLNQCANADAAFYAKKAASTRLLLGPRYVLLRREFQDRSSHRERSSIPICASKLLVTLGGSDPDNGTQIVLDSLRLVDAPALLVRVVLGAGNPNALMVTGIPEAGPISVEIVRSPALLSDLMQWCDFAVASAGTTAWELAFMGVPFLAVTTATNQELSARSLGQRQIAINLGAIRDLSPQLLAQEIQRLAGDYAMRVRSSRAGQEFVDGQGTYRVLQAMGFISLRLEPAREADSRMLWEWANEPDVRRVSFSSDPISWDDHQRWFAQKLNEPDTAIWIGRRADDQPVGQIRLECRGNDAVYVSLSVVPDCRGQGLGRQLIELGTQKAFRIFPGRSVQALVKAGNLASAHTFQKAGFAQVAEECVKGCRAFRFIRQIGPDL